ncbi:DsbA family protein [Staphylococcus massiliensis]|uniref:Protein-disulfide isomerase n=1 Tax=Staphylococcus massiliensis S46 TaxID=1229783 RepID=K9B024_9STAP|nr:thioredoxin domain-containing protein [Staphylococcus massiliensis]EKU48162.1 protein-disulfide isomerase [Staphylococcus massiliensis S46]MCG3402087.1 DsbA family protein [Staphylococcus massiliensis]MCG3412962.1 DsbA family protein [Staphylococcus massiliensis]POA00976.1 protein-disulfide isomerase [Staphylococcus massiliensis CCUG 55927]
MLKGKTNKFFMILTLFVIAMILITVFLLFQNKTQNHSAKELFDKVKDHPTMGHKDAKVKVVEFGDYTCPYCKALNADIKKHLYKDFDKKDVSFTYATRSVHGEVSDLGNRAMHAVHINAPDKYWAFHQAMFDKQTDEAPESWMNEKTIQQVLKYIGVSESKRQKIQDAYQNPKSEAQAKLDQDKILADEQNVKQVPSVFVNGHKVENGTDYKQIKAQINKELKQK